MKLILFTLFIVTIFLVSFVYAAGGSAGKKVTIVEEVTDCEDKQTVKERVQCRLETGTETGVQEACRGLTREDGCVTLHKRAYSCYELQGILEDECLKQKLRFTYSEIKKEFTVSGHLLIRSYLVLLFYDLQERIEERYTDKKITAEQAADLIGDIVEIKHALLSEVPISEIKKSVNAFKIKWKERIP